MRRRIPRIWWLLSGDRWASPREDIGSLTKGLIPSCDVGAPSRAAARRWGTHLANVGPNKSDGNQSELMVIRITMSRWLNVFYWIEVDTINEIPYRLEDKNEDKCGQSVIYIPLLTLESFIWVIMFVQFRSVLFSFIFILLDAVFTIKDRNWWRWYSGRCCYSQVGKSTELC